MSRIHRTGFRQQLILTFGLGILLTSLLSSLVISSLSGRDIYERLVKEGYQAVETFASQSTLALLYQSPENANEYADALLSHQDVLGLSILDPEHGTLFSAGEAPVAPLTDGGIPERAELVRETEDAWYFAAPVYSSPGEQQSPTSPFVVDAPPPALLGYVQMTMGKNTLHTLSGDILRTNFLVSTFLAVGLLILLLLITGRVTRPLSRLAATMRRAEQGEKKVRADIQGPKDLTRMQTAFNKMMEVLEAREKELEAARDSALESARLKGEFAATVSHELRTPLNGVMGMLELLKDMGLSPKQTEYVEVAKTSGESLVNMINDILDFTRNDTVRIASQSENISIRDLLDEIVGLIGGQARMKGLDFVYTVDHQVPPLVYGDANRLRQILINLIGNAIKFTDRGNISVTVHRTEEFHAGKIPLTFEVSDTGIGIAESAQSYIFEPFRQIDGSSTRKYEGTGLGLAICRQLIELLGGEIHVSSEPGHGTRFTFHIPFEGNKDNSKTGKTEVDLAGLRVLIVSDSDAVRHQIFHTCEYWGLYTAQAGERNKAIALLHAALDTKPFDYLILDDATPGLGRKSLQRLLETDNAFSNIRIILISDNRNSQHQHHSAVIKGCVDKPVRHTALYKSLNAALHARRPDRGNTAAISLSALSNAETAAVLVVEDNRSNQFVATGMLDRLGIRHTVVASGREALQELRQNNFDLVLMDCNMPEMDGYETTRRIRQMQSVNSDIPIIAMTANAQEGDRDTCFSAGMNDYISKPISLGALQHITDQWIRGSKKQEDNDRRQNSSDNAAHAALQTLNTESLNEIRDTIDDAFPGMLRVYLEDLPRYIDQLGNAINDQRAEDVTNAAHAVKGSSLNFGAERLAELCRLLEVAGGNGDMEKARELFSSITSEAGKIRIRLEREIPSNNRMRSTKENSDSYILVADDDRATRFAFRNVLEEEGYNVIEAEDGASALEIFRYRAPDLVLMDAKMPIVDGFSACEYIRAQDSETDQIPVLIITALDDEKSIERAFSVGATDYIPKPVNFSVLRKRIAHLMQATRAEQHMRYLAHNDLLTGLPNRSRFTDYLSEMMKTGREAGAVLALMFIDVDRFKLINDTLGHDTGDMLLKVVAERIRGRVRDDDMVARLGGDEYTVLLNNVKSRAALEGIAAKICDAFSKPIVFMDQEIFITISIGISQFPGDAMDIATLMKHADTAMFYAKKYRDSYRFYEEGMEAAVTEKLEMENDLRRALEREEFVLHYQPQQALENGKIIGMEALVRWEHPERGMVPPMEFIPLAEETGLIAEIGDYVLRESCRQLRAWLDAGYGPLRIAVNLSGRQLDRKTLAEDVADILHEHDLPPACLELEITESVIMEHADDVTLIFHKFKDMNIMLAVDDFGTGYSSLSHLKNFPIDTLKIDRSFLRDIPEDSENVAIISGIIAMAQGLGLHVVAEGVETRQQQDFLRDHGCDYIQGFYLGKPVAAEEFERQFLRPSDYSMAHGQGNIAFFHRGKPRPDS